MFLISQVKKMSLYLQQLYIVYIVHNYTLLKYVKGLDSDSDTESDGGLGLGWGGGGFGPGYGGLDYNTDVAVITRKLITAHNARGCTERCF